MAKTTARPGTRRGSKAASCCVLVLLAIAALSWLAPSAYAQDTVTSQVSGTIDDTSGQVTGTVEDTTGTVTGTVDEVAGAVTDATKDTPGPVEDAIEIVEDTVDSVESSANKTTQGTQDTVNGVTTSVTDTNKDDPSGTSGGRQYVAGERLRRTELTWRERVEKQRSASAADKTSASEGLSAAALAAQLRAINVLSASDLARWAPVSASPSSNPLARLADVATEATKTLAFPFTLTLMVVGFLLIQGRVDGKDPKLALAPIDSEQDFLTFS